MAKKPAPEKDTAVTGGAPTSDAPEEKSTSKKPKLVKMVREVAEGSDDPTSCDVHPSEVDNYKKGGWEKK